MRISKQLKEEVFRLTGHHFPFQTVERLCIALAKSLSLSKSRNRCLSIRLARYKKELRITSMRLKQAEHREDQMAISHAYIEARNRHLSHLARKERPRNKEE